MLAIVLILNGIIGLGCLLTAWQLWKLKRKLSHFADILISAERSVHHVLEPAPDFVLKGQSGTYRLRQNLQRLEPRLQQLRQITGLLGMGQFLWRRGGIGKRIQRKRRRTERR